MSEEEEEEGRRQRGRRSGGRGTREKEARVDSGVMYVGMTSESVGARPPCEYIEAFGRHYGAIRAACRGETLIYTGNYLCLFPPRESSLLPKLYLERGIFPTFVFNRKETFFDTFLYEMKSIAYIHTILVKNIRIEQSRNGGRNKLGVEKQREWRRGSWRIPGVVVPVDFDEAWTLFILTPRETERERGEGMARYILTRSHVVRR